jgi:hypothetical protein
LFNDGPNYWDSLALVLLIPHQRDPLPFIYPTPINNLFKRWLEGCYSQFQTCRSHTKTIRGTHQVVIDSKPLLAAIAVCDNGTFVKPDDKLWPRARSFWAITIAQTMSAAFLSSEVGRMEEIIQAGFNPLSMIISRIWFDLIISRSELLINYTSLQNVAASTQGRLQFTAHKTSNHDMPSMLRQTLRTSTPYKVLY